MSALETLAKPYLTPLIKGGFILLDQYAKNVIATWVALKMLVADHNWLADHIPDPIFDQAVRDSFRLSRKIPDGIRIWIGSQQGTKWKAAFYRSTTGVGFTKTLPPPPQPARRGPNTKAITWGMGRLLIYADAVLDPKVEELIEVNHQGTLRRVWPLDDTALFFPLPFQYNDWQIDALAIAFDKFIRRAVVTWVPS